MLDIMRKFLGVRVHLVVSTKKLGSPDTLGLPMMLSKPNLKTVISFERDVL